MNIVLKTQELPLFNGKRLKVKERTNTKHVIIRPKTSVNFEHDKTDGGERKRTQNAMFPCFLIDDLVCKLQEVTEVSVCIIDFFSLKMH